MMCNCKITEIILGIVVLIFAFVSAAYAKWLVALAAVLLIIHAFTCRNICGHAGGMSAQPVSKAKKK